MSRETICVLPRSIYLNLVLLARLEVGKFYVITKDPGNYIFAISSSSSRQRVILGALIRAQFDFIASDRHLIDACVVLITK